MEPANVRHERRLTYESGWYMSLNGDPVHIRSGPRGITRVNGIPVQP
eukprot:CAMPEP_0176157956 /NCGR_PEP_ID=MMETSP0120_2-20121206/80771_1 /TAXON_ID=160619 /ORGANISM="Kryptoperidinium foliaceum, Strain CCMP 1326" /LENGTH=46 /DNA_ID= /DNA_START= /DNA_END= /DNA_ORIENTATION=